MNSDRITYLIKGSQENNKEYVLYFMQQSARVSYNHALAFAIKKANEKNLPLVVCFLFTDNYLGANRRHYQFLLEGIKEVAQQLDSLGITFITRYGDLLESIQPLLEKTALFVMDYGYLKPQLVLRRSIYNYIKTNLDLETYMIESDVLIPVRKAYPKLAYGAYVLRPHLIRKRALYKDFKGLEEIKNQMKVNLTTELDFTNINAFLDHMKIDQTIKASDLFKGGYSQALLHLEDFFTNKIKHYENRNDPSLRIQSYLSIYLHFGQISVLEIIDYLDDKLSQNEITLEIYDSFFEQLVVRRELSFNFVTYQPNYDTFSYMTEKWAYDTMKEHENDPREFLYHKEELELGKTHDIYFNAAMKEMRVTGFMAGYMRMYWAKKIMEWSLSMQEAYETIVDLNNKYFLDGRDPNSYQNIAWCFGKADRPWANRNIFGTLRYMNSDGLKRKFKIEQYLEYIDKL
ncbi:deoxyribodipyrimidine photolyase [Alteracholeplasma palmae J233]|uniref:Deoxyribodipyrimidine photo-lyase n=1 Tax=Alteracholeplasma palmae (strain ATCC 49389 / J233) TaxID=1318466 RepID=U4KJY2_ALTPJ|nr:deoxyribodipyrimidine photo-lyase [Alteracholeplasma palmae]CCV63787.1 deoxyribodipyrimidine photolyase [Alteracholeplasma palmae J233]